MPWSERSQSRAAKVLLSIAALAALLVGCSDDDQPAASTTTTTASSTTTSSATTEPDAATSSTTVGSSPTTAPGTTPEQEVVDRYIGYWNARLEANTGTPDPNDPALLDFATGAQLDAVIAETQSNLDEGLAFRRADDPHGFQQVTVLELEGDRAVVQECVVSDDVVYRRDNGEVVNDAVATHNVRGELRRVDGVWRVAEARLLQSFEGVAACALDS